MVYKREGDRVLRYNACVFGPGDIYCSLWSLLALAGLDAQTFTPQFTYWRRPDVLDDGGEKRRGLRPALPASVQAVRASNVGSPTLDTDSRAGQAIRRKREKNGLSMSFLDVVSCGFGAVILLLVVNKAYEPTRIDRERTQIRESIAALKQELGELQHKHSELNRAIEPLRTQARTELKRVQLARNELMRAEERSLAARTSMDRIRLEEGELRAARQELTEEMERLLADYEPATDSTVVGIPADTDYIVFVIDTSGSMVRNAWPAVQRLVHETLRVYPAVKGVQVLNDEGRYLFPAFAGEWIPDSPQIRELITQRIRYWRAFSDSNPAEGIAEAINSFYDGSRKMSIHVYGDDFPPLSAEALVRYVEHINRPDRLGNRPVRIHGVGFPVHLANDEFDRASHFANLMRVLCERNGGTFVARTRLDQASIDAP